MGESYDWQSHQDGHQPLEAALGGCGQSDYNSQWSQPSEDEEPYGGIE